MATICKTASDRISAALQNFAAVLVSALARDAAAIGCFLYRADPTSEVALEDGDTVECTAARAGSTCHHAAEILECRLRQFIVTAAF